MRYKPPTIDSYGGVTAFLDAKKEKHNGYGADDLKKNWRWGTNGMNITNLAIMFGVSWPTMDDYINRLHAEAHLPRPKKEVASTSDLDNNSK